MYLAGALGFEPRMAVPKTAALPLGYAPILWLIYHNYFNLNSFCNNAPVFWVFFFKFFQPRDKHFFFGFKDSVTS